MRKKIIFILLFISCIFFLLPISYEYMYDHILNMISNNKIIPFYLYDINIDEKYNAIINKITNFVDLLKNISFDEIKTFAFEKVLTRSNIIISIYCINILVILYGIFDFWTTGTNKKYYVTKSARLLIIIVEFFRNEYRKNMEIIIKNLGKITLIFLISSGWIVIIGMETILFVIDYIVALSLLIPDVFFINIFKFLVIEIFDFVFNSNCFLFVIILLTILFLIGYLMAWNKLKKNWEELLKLVDGFGTISVCNGPPGTGKTLSITQFSLAQEENMIRINEDIITKFELSHPDIDFNYIHLLLKCYFYDVDEKEFNNILKYNSNILLDLSKYRYILDNDLSRVFFNIYYRGTSICSSYSINDPYFNSFTRKADIQSFRLFKKQDSMYHESDEILTLSEFDKEFNSHDDKKTVGEDGTAAFFSIFSHLSKRTGKVFIDYQDKDQGIRRIRALAHCFIDLENRKVSMPFIFKIFYKINLRIFNILLNLINKYRYRKVKTEKYWTVRRKQNEVKKNKIDLLYVLIKYMCFFFYRIVLYFEKFQFFIISGRMAYNDEFRDAKKIRYKLNVMDFYHKENEIYKSCQFNKFYADLREIISKQKDIKQSLVSTEKWTSLDPDANEYAGLHMRFYSKIVQAQYDE